MLTLATRAAVRAAALDARLDPQLRALLRYRYEQLGGTGACFHVVQPGDDLAVAEAAVGWPILDEGEPCWEWARAHPGGWHEVTFVLSDDGPAQVLVAGPDADAAILEAIRAHA